MFARRNIVLHLTSEQLYILSSSEWRLVATLHLTAKLTSGTVLWREPPNWLINTRNRGFIPFDRSTASSSAPLVINISRPSTIAPTAVVANSSPSPKSGVVSLEFSASGSLLLVTWEQCPNLAFIYNFPGPDEPCSPRLRSVIQCNQPVLHARISNAPTVKGTTIALCAGAAAVYIWNDDRELDEPGKRGELAECVSIPTGEQKFSCKDLRWSPEGRGLILLDKDLFCAAFEAES